MFYSIRHDTRFRYSAPITESVMEARMQPRSEGIQRCLSFELSVSPSARTSSYRDHSGNMVHHFTIPSAHTALTVTAKAMVEMKPALALPDTLNTDAWQELDRTVATGDFWEVLMPSRFARPTEPLRAFAQELKLQRRADPLRLLRELNIAMYDAFDYVPKSTKVDSPIDDALQNRKGVCQDFAHIMTALVREVRIPCRYVSGYLLHRAEDHDRSSDGATHAWVEAFLPPLGWIGFDPTNNLIAGERHIRVAIGRDYADVPPTRGVFKGESVAESELGVAVKVSPTDAPLPDIPEEEPTTFFNAQHRRELPTEADYQQQQQQQ
jgi:transglutaminase-like putative cysteine protease